MSANYYGIKVSLPGFDVLSATPEQCAVHSSYPPLKSKTNQPDPHFATLVVDFTGPIALSTARTLYTFNHGYGYVPFNIASIVFDDGTGGSLIVGLNSAGVGGRSIYAPIARAATLS
jgi:hypothetical protein